MNATHISIPVSAVLTTLQALAAVQQLGMKGERRVTLAPILNRERTGLLRQLVRDAWIQNAARLSPLVVNVDPGDPGGDDPWLGIDLLVGSSGLAARALEQAAALQTLWLWAASAGDMELAAAFEPLAGAWLERVAGGMDTGATGAGRTCVRPGWPG